jgi:DnaA family protein
MKQLLLDIAPPSSPTLENFVPGRNLELIQILKNILEGQEQERFIYLWGGKGCGKSHLLQAIVEACARNKLDAVYISCGITPNTNTGFSAIDKIDCLTIDDVDHLNASTQIDLFNLYNHIRDESHSLMLVSGSVAPSQLNLREDLVTRLRWGLVYQVHDLSDDEKIQAMQNHAKRKGFELPQDVCNYLLRHVQRDLPSLIVTLDALDLYSLRKKRSITIPMLRKLLLPAS